ncbi:hypothetical protein PT974_05307 [Cladobotryum mycophilum]|uniref:SnoaL-like domain-containing protein n=1 Tax=Cladobotryum mycophilum TaxID=491253 RepID=A0ABR0SIC5_9HYPO
MRTGSPGGGQAMESFETLRIKNTNVNQAADVSLSPRQQILVGSVLDLFEGHPTLGKLALWNPAGLFKDPLAYAEGYDRFAAQWYGLAALFGPIHIQSHQVTSAENPIELSLSNKYVVKGVGIERTINSVVRIHVNPDGRIEQVEDRWNDQLPEGGIGEFFRKLNAKMVPAFVTVPKTEADDRKMEASRESAGG